MSMFGKLRMRLVLTNVAISGLIVVVIAAVAYVLIAGSIADRSQQMMQLITADFAMQANSGEVNADALEKTMGGLYPYFVVEADGNGASLIADRQKGLGEDTMLTAARDALAKEAGLTEQLGKSGNYITQQKAAAMEAAGSVIKLDGRRYRYSDVDSKSGVSYLIFVDMTGEEALIGNVILALSVCAAAGLAMVFFGGLFLAGRSIAPIRAAWQKQRDFVADASHELRSPLAAMRVSLDAVLSRPESTVADKREFLDGMGEEMSGMARLVDDMLLIARADSGAAVFARENVNIAQTVESAVGLMRPASEKKALSLALDIAAAPLVTGDAERLRQAVLILLDNAIKYTPEGGSVGAAVKYAQGKAVVEVSDTGIGIDKKDMPFVFERFYRADRARSRESGGQGLGLSIAKWIIEEHGGKIEVSSEPGKGSVFSILLPEKK